MASPPLPFQAFTVKSKGRRDRIITDIEVFPPFDPAAGPPAASVKSKALWDTGASRSNISSGLVGPLGLVSVGTVAMNHAGGSVQAPTYLVNIGLPHGVLVTGILAAEFVAGLGFGVLIGMDVICMGDFSITNVGGHTCVSFRTPSCECIDYVAEANKLTYAGTHPNAPCPCGSGKKFKKCHRP